MSSGIRTPLLVFAAVLAIAIAPKLAAAHGVWYYPTAVTPVPNRFNTFGFDECAVPTDEEIMYDYARLAPTVLAAGQPITLRYHIKNADGGGSLKVKIDPSGGNEDFSVDVPVIVNVPGKNGQITGNAIKFPSDVDVVVIIPPTACYGAGGTCMLRASQGAGFATCAVIKLVQQNPQTGQFVPLSYPGMSMLNTKTVPNVSPLGIAALKRENSIDMQTFLQGINGAGNITVGQAGGPQSAFGIQAQQNGIGFQGQQNGIGFQGQQTGFGYQGQQNGIGFQGQQTGYGYQGQQNGIGFQGQQTRYGYQGRQNGFRTRNQQFGNQQNGAGFRQSQYGVAGQQQIAPQQPQQV